MKHRDEHQKHLIVKQSLLDVDRADWWIILGVDAIVLIKPNECIYGWDDGHVLITLNRIDCLLYSFCFCIWLSERGFLYVVLRDVMRGGGGNAFETICDLRLPWFEEGRITRNEELFGLGLIDEHQLAGVDGESCIDVRGVSAFTLFRFHHRKENVFSLHLIHTSRTYQSRAAIN